MNTVAMQGTVKNMNAWTNIKAIMKRELGGYFTSPVAYVFLVIFLLLTGFFTFTVGNFFERGEASLVSFFHVASMALSVPGACGRYASMVGRAALGYAGVAVDDAGHDLAGDHRKISRVVDLSGRWRWR